MTESKKNPDLLYRLVFPGNILPGTEHDEVVFELARLLKTSPDQAIRLVSGKRRYVKRSFSYEKADILRVQVLQLGVECEIEIAKEKKLKKPLEARRQKHFPKPESIAMQPVGTDSVKVDDIDDSELAYSEKMAAFEKHASEQRNNSAPATTFDDAILSFNDEKNTKDEKDEQQKNDKTTGVKRRLAQFVGENVDAYLKQFDKFIKDGVTRFVFTWHWPAFFVPFFWALYRKLWVWSAVILISLIFLPLVANIVWGGLANYIYFKHCTKTTKRLRKSTSADQLDAKLREAGGTSTLALTGALLIILLLMNGLYWTNALSPVFSTLNENLQQIEQNKSDVN